MSHCKNNSLKEHYVTLADPFLYTVYGCILPIIVLIILVLFVLVLKLPGFMIYAILGFVISSIFLSGSHASKANQLNDLYYLFGMIVVGFVGVDLCAQNLMLALTWIILFAFVGYLTVIYKDVKRGYMALVVSFMPVILHMRYPFGIGGEVHNNFQVILTDVVSIAILFSVILVFALLYPMRYKTTAIISAIESIYLVRNILNRYSKDEMFSDARLQLNDYLEKLKTNAQLINPSEKNKKIKVLLRDCHSTLYHLELLLAFGFETNTVTKELAEQYKNKLNDMLDGAFVESKTEGSIGIENPFPIQQKVLKDFTQLVNKLTNMYPILIENRKRYA